MVSQIVIGSSSSGTPYETYKNLTLSTTPAVIKSSAGKIYGWYIFNSSTATRYVRFWNKASAPVLASDSSLVKMTLAIPKGQAANVCFVDGINFDTGIGVAVTTAAADNDTTAGAAGDIILNVFYL